MREDIDIKQFHTDREIVICPKCNGSGIHTWQTRVDYHKNDYITEEEICSACNGTGRLIKTKKWLEWTEPFDAKEMAGRNLRRNLQNEKT